MSADGLRDELQAIMQGSITTGNGVDRVMAVLQRHIDAACEQERNYRSGDEIALAQVKVRDQLGQLRLERDAAVARAEAAEQAYASPGQLRPGDCIVWTSGESTVAEVLEVVQSPYGYHVRTDLGSWMLNASVYVRIAREHAKGNGDE